ncbi:11890_t:CDS:1 [Racocetra persica]|uniref:11890_t:CDS:1 n=1 Tax=Racocetra persica TaxID=160502 RepID=A0ACA9MI98_9GLOM|nr:11890_t:CDS:1 [Racocetra persica]
MEIIYKTIEDLALFDCIVINCVGNNADITIKINRNFIDAIDRIEPICGQTITLKYNSKLIEPINFRVIETDSSIRTYCVVHRNEKKYIIGGTYEPLLTGKIDENSYEDILNYCKQMIGFNFYDIISQDYGFRPYLKNSPRVEIDQRYPNIIHNYSYGSSGFSSC